MASDCSTGRDQETFGKASMSVKDRIAIDPVCGMKVDRQNPRGNLEYESRRYRR